MGVKLIVAGGRDFSDHSFLLDKMSELNKFLNISEIVSGCAKGADTLGERFAVEFRIPIKRFPADWDTHKKAAGPIRNTQMAKYADVLVAFWDKKSRGTKHMIDTATKEGLQVYIFNY